MRRFSANRSDLAVDRAALTAARRPVVSRLLDTLWSLRGPMPADVADKVRSVLKQHYDPAVLKAFDTGFERFNTLSPGRASAAGKQGGAPGTTSAAAQSAQSPAQPADPSDPARSVPRKRGLNPVTWLRPK